MFEIGPTLMLHLGAAPEEREGWRERIRVLQTGSQALFLDESASEFSFWINADSAVLRFYRHRWSGVVNICVNGLMTDVDLYSDAEVTDYRVEIADRASPSLHVTVRSGGRSSASKGSEVWFLGLETPVEPWVADRSDVRWRHDARRDGHNWGSFFQRYADVPLGQLFSDASPVDLVCDRPDWIAAPSAPFLEYIRSRSPLEFEWVSHRAEYLKQPHFMICQTHRLSTTTTVIDRLMRDKKVADILDIGAYPFSMCFILRELLRFDGRLSATSNTTITDAEKRVLSESGIDIEYVNLDRYVLEEDPCPNLREELPFPDNCMDIVMFCHVIEHLYHPMTIIREIFRVLRPGGSLVLSTDNARMVSTLWNYLLGAPYIHEPVSTTSAMSYSKWRGHVRFFTGEDVEEMLLAGGFSCVEKEYVEVLYDAWHSDYFGRKYDSLPKWKSDILAVCPEFRNEMIIIGKK